jgi:SsrA-binding protein
VKSLRAGRASLVDGYAFVEFGEAWLDAVHIPEYNEGTWNNHPPRRKRKLLLHKQQILKIHNKVKEGGYTLVPLRLYFLDGRAKVELAVAKGNGYAAQSRRLTHRPCLPPCGTFAPDRTGANVAHGGKQVSGLRVAASSEAARRDRS